MRALFQVFTAFILSITALSAHAQFGGLPSIEYCGDGVVTGGEECDPGMPSVCPDMYSSPLPADCACNRECMISAYAIPHDDYNAFSGTFDGIILDEDVVTVRFTIGVQADVLFYTEDPDHRVDQLCWREDSAFKLYRRDTPNSARQRVIIPQPDQSYDMGVPTRQNWASLCSQIQMALQSGYYELEVFNTSGWRIKYLLQMRIQPLVLAPPLDFQWP